MIFERDFSTQNFNDLGLCQIFHHQNVTMAIAWQTVKESGFYKPIERFVNPISLGIPTICSSSQRGFNIAIGNLPDRVDRESMLASSVKELQENLSKRSATIRTGGGCGKRGCIWLPILGFRGKPLQGNVPGSALCPEQHGHLWTRCRSQRKFSAWRAFGGSANYRGSLRKG